MCSYHYSYVSTCRHAEFTRISYCNNAIALGLPRTDGCLPDDPSADGNPGTQPGSSSVHPPASSANNSSSSHPQSHTHTQQQHQSQHNSNMSTLTPSEAGRAPTWDAIVQERDAQAHHQTAFIPRSALVHGPRTRRANTLNDASPVLDRQDYSNVNIDIPLNTQSSLHMEVTHDGKVTKLVARFESYGGYSDVCEESHADPTTGLDTMAAHHQEQVEHQPLAHTVGTPGHSPRKPIPAQWLPKSTGPNLATAQRAKARTYKNNWDSGSPDEVKTLCGTRSSIDLGRIHGKEGALYLTKEALAAVDNTIASPTSPLSPSRLHGSPTKRPWNSPIGSPLRSSARQQNLSFRMSPTKSTHLNTESISAGHSRAASRVATSTGRVLFHTAEGSPVRSPASTEHSFQSAAENPEDLDVPSFDLKTDNDDEQAQQGSSSPRSAAARANTEGKRSSLTPKLALRIPPSDSSHDFHESSQATPTLSPGGPHMFDSPLSPDSLMQVSRIPRIGATSKIAVPLRSSNIKQVESVKSLRCKVKMLQAMQADAMKVPLPETPASASLRHVRTVDSTGSTPILSRSSESHDDSGTTGIASEDEQEQPTHVNSPAISAGVDAPDQSNNIPPRDANYDHVKKFTIDHEASNKAVKPENVPWGVPPAFAHGTTLARPISIPTIIVMMAHDFDIGNLNLDAKQDEPASAATDRVDNAVENVFSVRGRSERYVPSERKQADSGRSTQSSMGSNLRATATEFVPQPPPTTGSNEATMEGAPPASSHDSAGLPDSTVLDRNGIPFLWYMYGVQFAYEQGYRNGRPKSPKKFKQPKKQRASLSSPMVAPQSSSKAVSITNPRSATPLSAAAKQRLTSVELMPPPPVPTNRRQEDTRRKNYHPGPYRERSNSHIADAGANQPFSDQLNMIAQQTALSNRTNSNAPRHFNVDLTTVRNVGLPSGPRNMHPPTYYTVPRYSHRNNRGNGLYGGRGNAGVHIDATAPFPNPVPPQGRPDQGHAYSAPPFDYSGYTIGKESCGLVNITVATERGGGEPCNACAPDH